MKIQLRLLLSFLAMAAILAGYGVYTLLMGQTIDGEVDNLITLFDLRVERSTDDLANTLHLVQSLEETRRAMAEFANGDTDAANDMAASIEEFRQLHRELTQSNMDLVQTAIDAGRPEVADATQNHLTALRNIQQIHDRFAQNAMRYIDLIAAGNRDEARALRDNQIFADLEQMRRELEIFEDAQEMSSEFALEEFDHSIEIVDSNIARISTLVGGTLIVGLLVGIVLSIVLSRVISGPIQTLGRVAESIEADEFDLDALQSITTRSDELGQFARVFEHMAREVKAREDRLKQEVAELRIEIDQSKRSQDVEEIRNTEYYKELRNKAQAYRDSLNEGQDSASEDDPSQGA